MSSFLRNIIQIDNPELHIAVDAAISAGEILIDSYNKHNLKLFKNTDELFMATEVTVNKFLCDFLFERTGFKIISEELPEIIGVNNSMQWIIDPLDSSVGFFLKTGIEHPSIMIALNDDVVTILSVVYFPLKNEIFYAVKGKGAYKNNVMLKVNINEDISLSNSWVALNQYSNSKYETDKFKILYQKLRSEKGALITTIEVPYSGIALHLLDGSKNISLIIHDNNPLKVKQNIWDILPIQLIVEESGCKFLNSKGERYDYLNTDLVMISRNNKIIEELLSLS